MARLGFLAVALAAAGACGPAGAPAAGTSSTPLTSAATGERGARQASPPAIGAEQAASPDWPEDCRHAPPFADALTSDVADRYLRVSSAEYARLRASEAAGLLAVRALALPEESDASEAGGLLGWPIAASSGDTLVVAYRRRGEQGAAPRGRDDTLLLRSPDRGRTWQGPCSLRHWSEVPPRSEREGLGGMMAIGIDRTGALILKHDSLSRSVDGGISWTSLREAARAPAAEPRTSSVGNLGPRILDHPAFGLMAFNGWCPEGCAPLIRYSTDGGNHWGERPWDANGSYPAEPSALLWRGNVLLLSREHSPRFGREGAAFYMTQHTYRHEESHSVTDLSFATRRTNILGNGWPGQSPGEDAGVWAHDTPAVDFNPRTGRIELLHSHRYGAGPGERSAWGAARPRQSSLLLWSIDPTDLFEHGSAEWRFEATLLVREGFHSPRTGTDGLHPAGAVIDEARGVQHIFVYAGGRLDHPRRHRTGIFHIMRTLDTPALASFLEGTGVVRPADAAEPDGRSPTGGTPVSGPTDVTVRPTTP